MGDVDSAKQFLSSSHRQDKYKVRSSLFFRHCEILLTNPPVLTQLTQLSTPVSKTSRRLPEFSRKRKKLYMTFGRASQRLRRCIKKLSAEAKVG